MRQLSILALLLLAGQLVISQGVAQSPDKNFWPALTTENKPWTRWWWMGSAVNELELRRLLQEYAAKGFGGVEITPIYGVRGEESNYIDFLSGDWMKMLSVSIDEATRVHMGVDMNTGTGWPFGGPSIASENAAKKLRFYTLERVSYDSVQWFISRLDPQAGERLLALSGISERGERVNFLRDEKAGEDLAAKRWTVYAATQENTGQMVKRAAPGGEGLVFNHFSAEATLHYLDRFRSAMKGKNPGIRSLFNDSYELSSASSTSDLFEVFHSKKGYDLALYLQELSGKGEPELSGRIKSDYREVLGALLLENFTGTWASWAHSYGIRTRNQAHGSPANLIDLYSIVDIPEVETFHATYFPFLEEYLARSGHRYTESNRLFRKLASSAAHMKGGTLVSCETFTWLNEHFRTPLYQCKPEIDNLFTEGINHLFFHGTAYSPESAEWPGWLFYASVHMEPGNPQWEDVEAMNQYIARCQSILQLGEHTNDLLVYWSPDEYYHQAEGLELGLSLHNAERWIRMPGMDSLYAKGYQFDFISDRIIAASEVREGRIFTHGKVPYEAIILPPVKRIKLTTFKKLLQLARDGGRVVFSSMPELVSGFLDYDSQEEELASLVAALEFKEYQGFKMSSLGKGAIFQGDVRQVLDYLGIVRESLSDFHLKSISRKTRNGSYYFMVNHHKTRIDAWVEFKHGARNALFMDPLNGLLSLAESAFQGNRGKVHIVLEPGASMILYFTDYEIRGVDPYPYYKEMDKLELSGPWSVKAIRGFPFLSTDTLLANPIFWTKISGDPFERFAGTCEYSTSFSLGSVSGDDYLLRFDRVEASARVFVNGQEAGVLWSFPFELQVGPLLKEGKNDLRVQVSNLGANAIRDLDRRAVNWKKFHDINFVNLDYETFDASQWDLLPSGLDGKVELILLKAANDP